MVAPSSTLVEVVETDVSTVEVEGMEGMELHCKMALLNPSGAVTETFETTDDLTLDRTIGYEEDELDIEVDMASKVIEMYGDEISGGVAGEDLRSYEKNTIAFLAGYIA